LKLLSLMKSESMEQSAGVGQFWTPIMAVGGSLLHADSQLLQEEPREVAESGDLLAGQLCAVTGAPLDPIKRGADLQPLSHLCGLTVWAFRYPPPEVVISCSNLFASCNW
jgi:hypothetical protein